MNWLALSLGLAWFAVVVLVAWLTAKDAKPPVSPPQHVVVEKAYLDLQATLRNE